MPKMNSKYFAYASKSFDFALMAGVIALVLIGGYIVIQSIFRISINDKIQSYGQLRTIGATPKQIKRIVKNEGRKLGSIGILIGTVLGVCGGFLLFSKAVMGSTQQNVALDRKLKEKELAALQARDEELDGLFERIYEDNVSGKLSDDRFAKMSRRYEDEQKEISEKIKALRAEMDKLSSKSVTADMFISTVRKYTRAKVLTPRMLNELIDHIEVHQAEKIDGIWEQHLVIHYNCVGAIFIPDVFPLPAPQVSVNTRKGVVVNYAPGQLAV